MPCFRLLVFANEVVAYNHILRCEAATIAELERDVAAQIGLDFPVWIFTRGVEEFGNDVWRVTDLADLAETCNIEVRPQLAPSACLAVAAPESLSSGASPHTVMLSQGLQNGPIEGGCDVAEAAAPWEELVTDDMQFLQMVLAPGSEEEVYPGGDGWRGATSSGSEGSEVSYAGYDEGTTWSDGGVDSGSEFSTLGSELSNKDSDLSATLSSPSSLPHPPRLVDSAERPSHPVVVQASMVAVPPPPAAGPTGWRDPGVIKTETFTGANGHLRVTQSVQPYLAAGRQPLGVPNAAIGMLNMGAVPAMPSLPAQRQVGTNFQDSATTGNSADDCAVCPLCKRECESHHRLGFFWQKFGYDGPAYCTRCSAVFRAHIVAQTVSNEKCKCTRDQPCAGCALILGQFKIARKEAFAAMDSCGTKKPQVAKVPPVDDVVTCPHCADQVQSSTLGLFWRKFGYSGMPYCPNCSAKFRNHIIRQRSTKTKDCCRDAPCTVCDRILRSFGPDRATTFALMNSKSRAPQRGSTAAPASSHRRRAGSSNNSSDDSDSTDGSPALEALSAKRRKLSERSKHSRGGVIGSLPLATVAVLAFCAVTGLIADAYFSQPHGSNDPSTTTSYNCCSGEAVCDLEYCPALGDGPDACVRPWDMPNGMDFDTDCDLPGDQSDWCRGGATEGMDKDSVDKCFGPPHSSCDYSCLPGYTAEGVHECYGDDHVFSGGHCEPASGHHDSTTCCCGFSHCPALGDGPDACVRRWDMPNGMDFDTDCDLPGDRSDWCRGGATEGMDKDSVDKCFGPPHSSCDYSCLPGYMKTNPNTREIHWCHPGDHVFSGGVCVLDPRNSGGPRSAAADAVVV
jgi:hypothetical protein